MGYTTYNAKDIALLINNVNITGLGETMITCEKDEEFFTTSVGAQGDVVKSVTNNNLGTITVTINYTCPQRSMLINLAKAGTEFPVWLTSPNESVGGSRASFKNYPTIEYEAEAPEMEFEIQVFDYEIIPK